MRAPATERNLLARARIASEAAEDALARVNRTGSEEDKARLRRARELEDIEWDRLSDARERARDAT